MGRGLTLFEIGLTLFLLCLGHLSVIGRLCLGGESVIGRLELFRTTQDTIFFILIVDSLAGIAALRTEIEVAMEVENEHLAEVAHLRVLRVRRKGREIFGLDAIAFD